MEFFDKLGKKASEAYKITADKTGKLAKETKIKLKITDLKSQINDVYEEIGKRVYQKHVREHDEDYEKEVEEMCVKIDVLSDEIDGLLQQSLDLKDKRQCKVCFTEIEKDAKFCPNCGEKQEEPAKEVEIVETNENQNENVEESKEDVKVEEPVEVEVVEEDKNEKAKDDLEKTVEIESNVKLEDDE